MNKHLKALLVVGGLAALIVVAALFYQNSRNSLDNAENGAKQAIQLNQELPDFEVKDLTGGDLKLSQFKGKVVVVNFWASWCGPCVEEVPSLIGLLKTFPKDLEMIAISGDSSQADIDSFLKSFPEMKTTPNIHVVWDADKKLTQLFQIFRLPESFILSRDLKLVKKISGSIEWNTPEAIAYIKQVAFPDAKAASDNSPGEMPQDEHPVNGAPANN
jgi:thiol-disulfide isomerase/thioredoxin